VAIPPDLDTEDYVEGELERALGPRVHGLVLGERRKKVVARWVRYQEQHQRRMRRVVTISYEIDVDEFNEDRFLDVVDTGLAQLATEIANHGRDVHAQGEALTGVTIIEPPKLFVKVEGYTMRFFVYTLVFCHLKKGR